VYLSVIEALARSATVAVLGTIEHEGDVARRLPRHGVVNAIGRSFGEQLALWELVDLATGPPCGGLVPAYLTATPLLHWYKPGCFPTRRGARWDVVAERDYVGLGVRSSWLEVPEDRTAAAVVADAVRSRTRGT
jgi:hypothetical protein